MVLLTVEQLTRESQRGSDLVARQAVLTLTLSSDHRVADGALPARFFAEVRRLLENPVGLLLQ